MSRLERGPTAHRFTSVTGLFAVLAAIGAVLAWGAPGALGGRGTATGAASTTSRLRIPFPRYDGTLTPYTFTLAYPLVTLVYDTLLWRDAQGVPRPWLAQSVSRSRGGRRVTVRLRQGVRWQDGRPLSADDVAFSFRFVAARSPGTPELADVASVRVSDRLTVRFELRRPSLGFDQQPLADLPIVPRHLWQGLPSDRLAPAGLPLGSGPYRLVRARAGTGYEFEANPSYFRGRPQVERIEVPIVHQEDGAYTALRDRMVDMLPFSLSKRGLEEVGGLTGINVRRGPSYAGTALLLNLRRPPFDRPAVRQAVANALDLDRVVRNAGPGVGAQRGLIHPDSPWSSPVPLQRFDPGSAQRAFAALRPQPMRVLAPDNDPARSEAGRQVVLALQRAGATATLVRVSRGKLGRAIGETGATPDFDGAIVSTPALISYDPDFLDREFGSDPAAAPLNYAGYRNPEFDALARRVAGAPDQRSRRAAVEAELKVLANDLPAIPLLFGQGNFAYRPAIYDGWVFVKGSGILDKRSFLGDEATASGAPGSEQTGPRRESGTPALDVLGILSIVVLVGAALLAIVAAVALLRRRSLRRPR